MRQNLWKFLFALILIFSSAFACFAQTEDSEETPVLVPEQAMEEVVRRVLIWSFKPRNKPTVIYLADQVIKQSWLPKIKNIEFRLLSIEEIQQKDIKVHFFTEPDLSKNTYNIVFAFDDPTCESLGVN